jgi:hypothetical protein
MAWAVEAMNPFHTSFVRQSGKSKGCGKEVLKIGVVPPELVVSFVYLIILARGR